MKISVITASYNYENYITETIESVLNQTYQDWEMIIVDDGSKDNSVEVIKSYCEKDSRIKLYTHENGVNRGLIETLKLGLEKAQGEWIVFLESDDTILPDYMEKKLDVVNKYPDVKFIYNDLNLFGDEDAIKGFKEGYFKKLYKILSGIKFPARVVRKFNEINIVPTFSVVMLKKEILSNIDFECPMPRWTDYYWWVQLAYKYKFYYINEKLTNWRMHKSSYNSSKTDYLEQRLFLDVIIPDKITNGKFKICHKCRYMIHYFKYNRKKYFYIHAKDKEVRLFGKTLKYGKKKQENK